LTFRALSSVPTEPINGTELHQNRGKITPRAGLTGDRYWDSSAQPTAQARANAETRAREYLTDGQRQGDLLRLPWSSYDGAIIKLRQRKTGAYVPIPIADALRTALDAAPRRSPLMLTNNDGNPWSESGFQGAWGKATARAGIIGLTFHDLRGTAVVTLARAGCNEVEIYSITGHKPSDVQAILTTHYLPRDAEVASNAIAKLNQYKAQRMDEKLPTALPTAPKMARVNTGKSK
jgi:integrase